MGTIDSATVTITCSECGQSEHCRVLDKGNGWSGSHWQRPSFHKFQTEISGSAATDYHVTAATCLECAIPATVSAEYGT